MTRKPPIVSSSPKKTPLSNTSPSTPKRGSNTRTKKKSTPSRKQYREGPSIGWRLFKWLLVLGIWCGIFLIGVLAWFAKDLPDITRAVDFQRRTSIIVKAADGSTIARYGEMKGNAVDLNDISPSLIDAILATEDRRFYSHPGVDLVGISRAMVVNFAKGRMVQGGSTITQQLAKNLFLTHDRNMSRKIQEAMLALWLERQLSKDEILAAYMNRVYLGSGVYGVAAASKLYFDKDVKDINLRESAILAGLLKAPSRYSPLNNPDLAKKRSDVVLEAMLDAGYITKNDIKTASTQKISAAPKKSGESAARYFADWVIEGLDDLIGEPDMDIIVETTLDVAIQKAAEERLRAVINEHGAENKISQGAIMVMRPDGNVLAMVGGRDYSQSQFNRVTQALRSPGSAFKPFVYLAALRTGAKPETRILDAPITYGKYRPENFGKKYHGDISFEEALGISSNTTAFRIAEKIGIKRVIDTARDLGIIAKLEPDLSLSLGSSGVSMLEMNLAYATIANGGNRIYPYAITRITTSEGRTIYERKAPQSYSSVIHPSYIQDLKQMMRTVIEQGTGRRAKLPFTAYGKTGTSQDSRDAWFVGFSDRVVTSVWLGNDDNSPMKDITGASYPAEIWRDVMAKAQERAPATIMQSSGSHSYAAQGDSAESGGFGAFLGRIIGSAPSAPHQNNAVQRPDYSNLNE